jgi:hypothetical protein
MTISTIPLRVGVLDGDDPEAWSAFGHAISQTRDTIPQHVTEVPATYKTGTVLQPALLVSRFENLVHESKLREVIGLLVDGKDLHQDAQAIDVNARDRQIQTVCAAIRRQTDPLYVQTGFHVWVVVKAPAGPREDQVVLPTLNAWSLTTAKTLGIPSNMVSVQRLWAWHEFKTMYRMALEGAAHQIS